MWFEIQFLSPPCNFSKNSFISSSLSNTFTKNPNLRKKVICISCNLLVVPPWSFHFCKSNFTFWKNYKSIWDPRIAVDLPIYMLFHRSDFALSLSFPSKSCSNCFICFYSFLELFVGQNSISRVCTH